MAARKTVQTVETRIKELNQSVLELEQARQDAHEDLSQAQASKLLDDTARSIAEHKAALLRARRLAVKENGAKLAEMQSKLAPMAKKRERANVEIQQARKAVTVKEAELKNAEAELRRAQGARRFVTGNISGLERQIAQFKQHTGV